MTRANGRTSEIVSRRTATTSTWRNADGSLTVKKYLTPHYFKTRSGWQTIRTSLKQAPNAAGVWQAKANSWQVSLGAAGRAGGAEQVTDHAASVGFVPLGVSSGAVEPTVAGSTATYTNLWPDTNVTDTVTSTGVKEDLILDSPTAQTTYKFAVRGATVREDAHGGVDVLAAGHAVGQIPPPTVSTSGRASSVNAAEATLSTRHGIVSVSVSHWWLTALPATAFPVTIDPTYMPTYSNPTIVKAFSSTGATSAEVTFGSNAQGTWASTVKVSLPAPPAAVDDQPWQLGFAQVSFQCQSACTLSGTQAAIEATEPTSYTNLTAGPNDPAAKVVAGLDHVYNPVLMYASLGNNPNFASRNYPWVSLIATSSTFQQIPTSAITFNYTYYELPPPGNVTSPANGSVIASTTPTLSTTVTDPQMCATVTSSFTTTCDNDVDYDFKISTSPTGDAGQVVADSGWLTGPSTQDGNGNITYQNPTWTVPAGSLSDGVTYYASVESTNDIDYEYPEDAVAGNVYLTPPAGGVTQFQVKLRLGAGGPSPTDTIGAAPGQTSTPSAGAPSPGTAPSSETVDLVTGNLAVTMTTPAVQTLAGPEGATLSYNSAQSSTQTSSASGSTTYGVTGQYYADSGSHTFPSGNPAAQRLDANVGLTKNNQPTSALKQGAPFLARWTGQILVSDSAAPAGTTFQIGGASTGGMQVKLNGATVYDDWNGTAAKAGQVGFATTSIAAGTLDQIEVDDWDANGTAPDSPIAQLWVNEIFPSGSLPSHARMIVPSTWLTTAPTGLPPGWTLASAAAPTWTSVTELGSQVVVHAVDGSTATFTAQGNGAYQPQPGDTDSLNASGGQLQLNASSGEVYVFNEDGSLASVTSAANDLKPAAMTYSYAQVSPGTAGSPIVLTQISDPVSNRSVTFSYSGQTVNGTPVTCPSVTGGATPPVGMLCQISYPDATTTGVYYNANGQLAEVLNPGGNTTLFGYDTTNRLDDIRDALANDYVAAGQPGSSSCGAGSSSCPFDTQVAYDSKGRVSSVTQPAPSNGAARPGRSYSYSTTGIGGTTYVSISGFNPAGNANIPAGDASSESYDAQSRVTAQTNSAGLSTHIVWDNDDRPIITVDGSGEQTSTIYDNHGNTTDTYGPAPEACFTAGSSNPWPTDTSYPNPPAPITGYLPVSDPQHTTGCATSVPHTVSGYDEGLTGLAATYWPNGSWAGTPTLHGTGSGIGGTSGAPCTGVSGTSSNSLCGTWPSGSAPGGIDGNGDWSMRLSGNLTVATAGTYTLAGNDSQPLSLSIDGTLVGTNVTYAADGSISSVASQFSGTRTLTVGAHTIEVDLEGSNATSTSYTLSVQINGTPSAIPLSILNPAYGLKTSTTDPDGDTSTTSYTSSGLGAQYGLITSTTTGAGTSSATTTSYSYETPGTGWLRKLSTTLPAGNGTSYQYYGGTEDLTSSTCGVSTSVPQGGQLKARIDPAPSTGAPSREQQFVYDAMGRTAGIRVGPSTSIDSVSWQCTSYDTRSRLSTQTWPAFNGSPARTVTYTYSVAGDPLMSSVTDNSGSPTTIESTVDLLGRATSYTDALGTTTTDTYDQAGQLTQTDGPQGVITSRYDATTGNLSSVATAGGGILAATTYNTTTGRLSHVTYSNGTVADLSYDANGRKNSLVFTKSSNGALVTGDQTTMSPAGRITTELENISGALTNPNPLGSTAVDYTYDGSGRLVTANLPGELATYSYANNPSADNCADPGEGQNTNRTSVTLTPAGSSAASTDYCYNTADQLSNSISNAGTSNAATSSDYTYDAHGNQTRDNGTALAYDASDRLASTTNRAGVITTYLYDAVNRVIARTTSGATTDYDYAGFTDAPSATQTGSGVQQIVSLPGGVTDTIQAADAFVPLTARILDTETGTGAPLAPIAARATLTLQATGSGGIPASGVSAVVLNLDARAPSSHGYLTAYPDGTDRPGTSNLNFTTGQNQANLVVVPVGADGKIDIYNGSDGTLNLIGDISGYYTSGTGAGAGSYKAVPTARILATTTGTGAPQAPVAAHATLAFQVTGQGSVPNSGVSAVVLNLTASSPSTSGYLIAYPDGTTRPGTLNLNLTAGQNMANLVVVPVGANGKVDIYNGSSGTVDLLADVSGYYTTGTPSTAGSYASLPAARILDTETGTDAPQAPVAAHATLAFQVGGKGGVPTTGVSAVVMNLDARAPTASGYLTAYPDGTTRPGTLNVNFTASQNQADLVVVPVGANGKVDIYNGSSGTVDLIADVAGYYLSGTSNALSNIWSYPDLHGNDTVTTNDTGTQLGQTTLYDPWGQPLSSPVAASNAAVTNNFTSYGDDGKISDQTSGVTIMGARPYISVEGRFAGVDPIEGGCANPYVYAFGDPLDHPDFTGMGGCLKAIAGFGLGLGAVAGGVLALVFPEGGVAFGSGALAAGALSMALAGCSEHSCGLDGLSLALGGFGVGHGLLGKLDKKLNEPWYEGGADSGGSAFASIFSGIASIATGTIGAVYNGINVIHECFH